MFMSAPSEYAAAYVPGVSVLRLSDVGGFVSRAEGVAGTPPLAMKIWQTQATATVAATRYTVIIARCLRLLQTHGALPHTPPGRPFRGHGDIICALLSTTPLCANSIDFGFYVKTRQCWLTFFSPHIRTTGHVCTDGRQNSP